MLIKKYIEAIKMAEDEGDSVGHSFLSGFSGEKLLGALQRLTAEACGDKRVYCEVGVFQGLSLISVASANPSIDVYGIDNFAFFDPENKNKDLVLERMERAKVDNVKLLDLDYEDALETFSESTCGSKIGTYFIDGPHDYRSQLMCLMLAKPLLAEGSVIVVDDCNYAHVRQANRDFLVTHPEFKLLFESYTSKHPQNMTEDEQVEARKNWWNGVNILVHDPENELQHMEPPTIRSRQLYENEHDLHAMRQGHVGNHCVQLANYLSPFRPIKLIRQLLVIVKKVNENTSASECSFDSMNVYTDGLKPRLNELRK